MILSLETDVTGQEGGEAGIKFLALSTYASIYVRDTTFASAAWICMFAARSIRFNGDGRFIPHEIGLIMDGVISTI